MTDSSWWWLAVSCTATAPGLAFWLGWHLRGHRAACMREDTPEPVTTALGSATRTITLLGEGSSQ